MKKFVVAATMSALLVAGVAYAAIPSSATGVITGCYKPSDGKLRVIDAEGGAVCATGESTVSWNQTGPTGATGANGDVGPRGDTGATGAQGATGATGTFSTANTQLVMQFTPVLGQTTQAFAHCPTGTNIVSGGYVYGHNYPFRIPINRPGLDKTSWEVWIYADTQAAYGDGGIEVWALCA